MIFSTYTHAFGGIAGVALVSDQVLLKAYRLLRYSLAMHFMWTPFAVLSIDDVAALCNHFGRAETFHCFNTEVIKESFRFPSSHFVHKPKIKPSDIKAL